MVANEVTFKEVVFSIIPKMVTTSIKSIERYQNEIPYFNLFPTLVEQPPIKWKATKQNGYADFAIYINGKSYCIEVKNDTDIKDCYHSIVLSKQIFEQNYIVVLVGNNTNLMNRTIRELKEYNVTAMTLKDFAKVLEIEMQLI